jgi:hypothetical protein
MGFDLNSNPETILPMLMPKGGLGFLLFWQIQESPKIASTQLFQLGELDLDFGPFRELLLQNFFMT